MQLSPCKKSQRESLVMHRYLSVCESVDLSVDLPDRHMGVMHRYLSVCLSVDLPFYLCMTPRVCVCGVFICGGGGGGKR